MAASSAGGSGSTAVEEISWGVIKSLYRDEAAEARERDSRPEVPDLRTAAYILAIEKVARYYTDYLM